MSLFLNKSNLQASEAGLFSSVNFLNIAKAVLFLLVFFFIFAAFNNKIWDPDLWWHLKTGEYISQTQAIPVTDPFSFTSLTKDPINPDSKRIRFILSQYWIAQLVFYWIYKLFSLQGIIYLRAGILTLLMLLLYKSLRREGAGYFTALLFLIPAVLVFVNFTGERPQLFSFLFTFLLVFLLEGYRKASHSEDYSLPRISHKKAFLIYLLPLPFIMMFWSNMHGGFIIGIVVVIGYICSEFFKYITGKGGLPPDKVSLQYLAGAGGIAVLFSLINPNGYNVIPLLIELNKSQYLGAIVEARSPLVFVRYGYYTQELYTFFSLIAGGFLLLVLNIRKLDITDVIIFSGLSALSLSAARVIPFFTPFSILIIVKYGIKSMDLLKNKEIIKRIMKKSEKLPAFTTSAYSKSFFAFICSVLIIVNLNNSNYFQSGIRQGRYPEGAVNFLKQNKIQGNMYNPYVWGGYLIWALYPDYKVFIDGRGLIEEVFFQSDKIMGASSQQFAGVPEWKAFLDVYKVSFIVTYSVADFTGQLIPLIPALYYDPEWHLVYMDNFSLIFVKDKPENSGIIQNYSIPKKWLWNEVLTEAAKKARDFRGNANYYITMGDALVSKENYREALNAYVKAQMIAPGSPVINEKLNMIRNMQNNN